MRRLSDNYPTKCMYMLQNFGLSGVRVRNMMAKVDWNFSSAKMIAIENFLAHGRSRFFFASRNRNFCGMDLPEYDLNLFGIISGCTKSRVLRCFSNDPEPAPAIKGLWDKTEQQHSRTVKRHFSRAHRGNAEPWQFGGSTGFRIGVADVLQLHPASHGDWWNDAGSDG